MSEIETLDITEAEERAGLRRVYDLVGELPIPPDKTRKLAGYIARIEAERDKALARHGLFMVEGGPVVMATEYDALKAELSQARASIASYNAGKDNLLRTIAALRDEARAACAAVLNARDAAGAGESVENPDEGYRYGMEIDCDDHERKLDALEAEKQIKRLVDRFLGWRLPENFNPDGGVSFKKIANENTAHERKNEPTGTNLLDASQAEEMVRYMLEGLTLAHAPAPPASGSGVVERMLDAFGEAPPLHSDPTARMTAALAVARRGYVALEDVEKAIDRTFGDLVFTDMKQRVFQLPELLPILLARLAKENAHAE